MGLKITDLNKKETVYMYIIYKCYKSLLFLTEKCSQLALYHSPPDQYPLTFLVWHQTTGGRNDRDSRQKMCFFRS